MNNQGDRMPDNVQDDSLWQKYWMPLRAAVLAGEISRESALRQWNAILDEEFAKRAKGRSWDG